jgi:hypothetical protein
LVMNPVEVDESGLKLSVIGESGVLSMTSGWPVAALDDGGDDEVELLHAATAIPCYPAGSSPALLYTTVVGQIQWGGWPAGVPAWRPAAYGGWSHSRRAARR